MIRATLDFFHDLPWWMIVAVAIVFGIVGARVVFEIRHPCTRYSDVKKTCSSMECTFYGENGPCQTWTTSEYDCTECLERKP